MGRSFEDDPLTRAMAPPPDETPEQRTARENIELEARKISDTIDEQIKKEKADMRKKKKAVRVLLLGQSESGKSTTLKNFQLTYARKAWAEERESWRAVVQLNLVRNVTTILAVLSAELDRRAPPVSPQSSRNFNSNIVEDEDDPDAGLPPIQFDEKHKLLRLRLGPLRNIQKDLEARLGAQSIEADFTMSGAYDDEDPHSASAALVLRPRAGADVGDEGGITSKSYTARMPHNDFFVRGTNGWKSALDKIGSKKRSESVGWQERERDDVSEVLIACREDVKTLWVDPKIRELLKRREVRMEDAPGFFLSDVDRICSRSYEVSDDDVIRARLRTVGVQEHKFVFDDGRAAGTEWLLYDVGGHRSARTSWAPYFDTVDAILFLAPISCFDEKLAEDSRVNRLEDTYLLWKSVSRNKLLAKTQIVLFLNKIDLLNKKLAAGVRLKDFVPSFADRPNDAATVVKYFQTHFREIAKQYNPEPRAFYVHLTSVVDTKATAATLSVVEEGILRDHLRKADLL